MKLFFSSSNKKHMGLQHKGDIIYEFLSKMDDTIEKYGAAIITENEDGKWEITAGGRNTPSCSAENNDNIEFVHNAEGGKE